MLPHLLTLCFFSITAGFVDAAVGGGGLIQLPAALILLPGVPIPTIFGTNKFSSLFGTSRFVRILFLVRLGGKAHADAALAVRYPIMSRWLVWKTSSLH